MRGWGQLLELTFTVAAHVARDVLVAKIDPAEGAGQAHADGAARWLVAAVEASQHLVLDHLRLVPSHDLGDDRSFALPLFLLVLVLVLVRRVVELGGRGWSRHVLE